jgi:hypothetical protein
MWWMLASAGLQAAVQLGAASGQRAIDKVNNRAIEAYNKQVAAQAAKSFNELAIQKTALSDQLTVARAATEREGLQVKSARGLQAAGTDTMGASVDQALTDVDMKIAEAQATLLYNGELSDMSLNAQASQVADTAGSSLRAKKAITNNWSAVLGQAVASFGMQLFENKARTGDFSGRTSRNQGIE